MLPKIIEGGGEGSLCEARFFDGLTDYEVEALLQAARAADYEQIAEDARRLAEISWPEGQIEDNCLSGKSQCWTKYGS